MSEFVQTVLPVTAGVELRSADGSVTSIPWVDAGVWQQRLQQQATVWIAGDWLATGILLDRHGWSLPEHLFDLKLAQLVLFSDREPERVEAAQWHDEYVKLKNAIASAGLERVFEMEMHVLPGMVQMSRGLAIDRERLKILTAARTDECDKITRELHEVFGKVNLRSNKAMLELLRGKGLELDDVKATTLAKHTQKIPALADLILLRTQEITLNNMKKIAAYADEKGVIHPEYHQIGAQTGRMSCSEPPVQQVSREGGFRECFIPFDGHLFVIADFSQIQIRIAAALSRDEAMLELIRTGQDIYRRTAMELFGCGAADVTDTYRKQAKIVVLSTMYGVSPPTLSDNIEAELGIPIGAKLAGEFQKKFAQMYPEFAAWRKVQRESSAEFITSLWGRRAAADFKLPKGALNRTRVNWPIQECEADMLKLTLEKISCLLKTQGLSARVRLALCVHDEIILEAENECAQIAADILAHAMQAATEEYLQLQLPQEDVRIASSWS